ncbi:MAG: riboflavin biosynthesis protein RibF, partial [Clostridia bacterium]|nr:riboflavin biosynthesis protein RibF [Clostridia bacterium]
MLNVVEYGKDEYDFPALIVLGCFDALHAGHRELLKKAKLQAKINGLDLGVMMFRDGKGGKLIYSFEERLAILEQFNVKFVVVIDFDEEFKKTAPLDFLKMVEDKINVKAYMSGKDFRFGAQAKGKSSTLKNYAEDDENGVWYMPIKDVDLNGEKISTTLIKSCLDEGNVAKANQLLGSEFSLTGEVVKGAGRGTSVVGYPTVNIVYPEWKHPLKHGVYSVKCLIGETDYQGVANFGTCPTFGDDRVALEAYFEGFSGDLYGQVLTVRFIDFVREIEEFASADELSGQIQSDLNSVSVEPVVTEATVAEVQPVEEAVAEETAEPIVEEVVAEETAEPVETAEEVVEEVVTEE